MIMIYLKGRLGNQLFQYAFARSAATKLETWFYFDKTYQDYLIPRYFEVGISLLGPVDWLFRQRGYREFLRYGARRRFYGALRRVFRLEPVQIGDEVEGRTVWENLSDGHSYEGYFQSEDFFPDSRAELLRKLQVRKKYREAFMQLCARLPKGRHFVTIHVRKGDYTDHGIALPMTYYHRAVRQIHRPENFYILISDDIDAISGEFAYLEHLYISRQSEIFDLQFLMHAKTCILSNSSFSWWGAYLNTHRPVVIAPRYWLGLRAQREIPAGIMQPGWEQLTYV
jgi:hypothetical protein